MKIILVMTQFLNRRYRMDRSKYIDEMEIELYMAVEKIEERVFNLLMLKENVKNKTAKKIIRDLIENLEEEIDVLEKRVELLLLLK